MKKQNFLKVALVSLLMICLMILVSCKKKPDCEKNNYGTVVVTNNSETGLWVDVTYSSGDETNDERLLGIGQSTTYIMTPGAITEWATTVADYAANDNWYTDSYILTQCEIHDTPWITIYGKGVSNTLSKENSKPTVSTVKK